MVVLEKLAFRRIPMSRFLKCRRCTSGPCTLILATTVVLIRILPYTVGVGTSLQPSDNEISTKILIHPSIRSLIAGPRRDWMRVKQESPFVGPVLFSRRKTYGTTSNSVFLKSPPLLYNVSYISSFLLLIPQRSILAGNVQLRKAECSVPVSNFTHPHHLRSNVDR